MTPQQLVQPFLADFDRTPTPAILAFEALVILTTAGAWWLLSRRVRRVHRHFLVVVIAVLIFEVFTAPMWNNWKLGPWAYLYRDVSWVLTIGWSTMILVTVYVVDTRFASFREWQRFILYLVLLTPIALVAESVVIYLGVRSYTPEVLAFIGDAWIPLLAVPVGGLYYVPVFMTLAISFYKSWLPTLEPMDVPEAIRGGTARRFALTFIGIFLFEFMIEPMVDNRNFPAWSYIFRDISVVMTLMWIVVVAVGMRLVDLVVRRVELPVRFAAYLVAISVIATPVEAWFIHNGYRVYGASATANMSGFRTALFDLPIEIAIGIPLYLALVLGFVRYWERIGSYSSIFAGGSARVASEQSPRPIASGASA